MSLERGSSESLSAEVALSEPFGVVNMELKVKSHSLSISSGASRVHLATMRRKSEREVKQRQGELRDGRETAWGHHLRPWIQLDLKPHSSFFPFLIYLFIFD